jgi:hypothetical protein
LNIMKMSQAYQRLNQQLNSQPINPNLATVNAAGLNQ